MWFYLIGVGYISLGCDGSTYEIHNNVNEDFEIYDPLLGICR